MIARARSERLRVLVNGGASGIGLACAEAFAACGAELILTDIDRNALAAAGERIEAYSRLCDSIADTSVTAFAADIAGAFPSVDVLINAAGRGYVRSLAMVRMTRAMLPLLRAPGGAARFVFNLSPVGGFASTDGIFPYASSVEAFDRLHDSLTDLVRGTSVELTRVQPQMLRAGSGARVGSRQLYALQRIDEQATARVLVRRVAVARPDWKPQSPPARADRRA